jgi:threonine aldolase
MVIATLRNDEGDADAPGFSRAMRERDIVIPATSPMRLVTHLDVDGADIDRVVDTARDYFTGDVRRAS